MVEGGKVVPIFQYRRQGFESWSGNWGFPGGASGKEATYPRQEAYETWVRSLGQEDSLEEGMATVSPILAWRIPWTEEPDGPQSIRSQRVGHD